MYVHVQFVTWVINLFIIIWQNKLEIIHEHNLVKTTTSGVRVQRNTIYVTCYDCSNNSFVLWFKKRIVTISFFLFCFSVVAFIS